jgi:hypothetical protein
MMPSREDLRSHYRTDENGNRVPNGFETAKGDPLPHFNKYQETNGWRETPQDIEYVLLMSDSGGDTVQQINITREEYIALKEHLVKLRDGR